MSSTANWYEGLFEEELQEIAVSEGKHCISSDDVQYEAVFYDRNFGIDFMVGKLTGCCVVATAGGHNRIKQGDIVIEVNGSKIATPQPPTPLTPFFGAIGSIRYASLPVTLRFVARAEDGMDVVHELYGESGSVLGDIRPVVKESLSVHFAAARHFLHTFAAVEGDLTGAALPLSWHTVAAAHETPSEINNCALGEEKSVIINGQMFSGSGVSTQLEYLLALRVRSKEEIAMVSGMICFLVRMRIHDQDAYTVVKRLFEPSYSKDLLTGVFIERNTMKPESEEVVINDGVMMRVTNWFYLYIICSGDSDSEVDEEPKNTAVSRMPRGQQVREFSDVNTKRSMVLEVKATIEDLIVPSSASPPSRSFCVNISRLDGMSKQQQQDDDDDDDDDDDEQSAQSLRLLRDWFERRQRRIRQTKRRNAVQAREKREAREARGAREEAEQQEYDESVKDKRRRGQGKKGKDSGHQSSAGYKRDKPPPLMTSSATDQAVSTPPPGQSGSIASAAVPGAQGKGRVMRIRCGPTEVIEIPQAHQQRQHDGTPRTPITPFSPHTPHSDDEEDEQAGMGTGRLREAAREATFTTALLKHPERGFGFLLSLVPDDSQGGAKTKTVGLTMVLHKFTLPAQEKAATAQGLMVGDLLVGAAGLDLQVGVVKFEQVISVLQHLPPGAEHPFRFRRLSPQERAAVLAKADAEAKKNAAAGGVLSSAADRARDALNASASNLFGRWVTIW
jgi:hypothetical protein